MREKLTPEENYLLKLLARIFREHSSVPLSASSQAKQKKNLSFEKLLDMAERHAVLPLLYDSLCDAPFLKDALKQRLTAASRKTAMQNYRLLFLSKYIIETLGARGISVALLKGASTSVFYPVPELRKSGDVDLLLLDDEKRKEACDLLAGMGFGFADDQHAQHHLEYMLWDGMIVELHLMLAEPFDNEKVNRYIEQIRTECVEHTVMQDVLGVSLPVLKDGFHSYYLLLHMLQHFLRSGFGLKLLCDWSAFWNRDVDCQEKQIFLTMVKESGLLGFARIISSVCVEYLGLKEKQVQFLFEKKSALNFHAKLDRITFILEVLEAEEFGNSDNNRMVMLRGTGFNYYLLEFHHQMRLNYAKASRVFILWPALWLLTLVRFLYNNRKIRNVSSRDILKKARSRSQIMNKMKLFAIEDKKERRKKSG